MVSLYIFLSSSFYFIYTFYSDSSSAFEVTSLDSLSIFSASSPDNISYLLIFPVFFKSVISSVSSSIFLFPYTSGWIPIFFLDLLLG